ncbi:hypothetical protein ABPG72_013519 [Tetrahymena utriculariae]
MNVENNMEPQKLLMTLQNHYEKNKNNFGEQIQLNILNSNVIDQGGPTNQMICLINDYLVSHDNLQKNNASKIIYFLDSDDKILYDQIFLFFFYLINQNRKTLMPFSIETLLFLFSNKNCLFDGLFTKISSSDTSFYFTPLADISSCKNHTEESFIKECRNIMRSPGLKYI